MSKYVRLLSKKNHRTLFDTLWFFSDTLSGTYTFHRVLCCLATRVVPEADPIHAGRHVGRTHPASSRNLISKVAFHCTLRIGAG